MIGSMIYVKPASQCCRRRDMDSDYILQANAGPSYPKLDQAADGSAFDLERERASIAKAGETAAERNERYAKWREAAE